MEYEDPDSELNEQAISDDEIVNICMEEISNSIRGRAGMNGNREISLPVQYYYGELPGLTCKDPRQSRMVSMDVRDAIEASVAAIMPSFTSGHIAEYQAESEQDEDQAKLESDTVNYLFMEKYNGHQILTTALKDTFLHRNCYAKTFWETRNEVGYETYEAVPEPALPGLLEPRMEGESIEVISHEMVSSEEQIMAHEQMVAQFQQQGQGDMPQAPPDLYNITLKRTFVVSEPVIASIAPEEAMIAEDLTEIDLSEGRFCAHRRIMSRSELIALGYDRTMIEELPVHNETAANYARFRQGYNYSSTHDSTAPIEVYECWIRLDVDGDGIAELRKITIAENQLLDNEPWDQVDMVAGATCTMPHQHEGISQFDVQQDIQDSKTDIYRALIDSAKQASQGRFEVNDSAVNMKDLLSSVTGGVVRSQQIGSVAPLATAIIPPTVFSTLEILDKMRRERGGSAIDSSVQGAAMRGNGGDAGLDRIMSAMELQQAMEAVTFAETFVRGMFLRLHSLLRKYHQGEIIARVDGQWTSTNPSQWPQRDRVAITVGASQGERQRKAGALGQIQQVQQIMLQNGMPTTTPEKVYESSVDMAHYMGLDNPDQYFVDPQSEEGMQLAQQQQQQQEQAMQEQQQDKQFQMQLQAQQVRSQVQLSQAEMAKAQVTAQNNQMKHTIDQLKEQLAQAKAGADVKLQEEEMNRKTAIDLLKIEQEANKDLDQDYVENKIVGQIG